MIKEIIFKGVGCGDSFDLAYDYMAIVEKIQTWNVSNELNVIDRSEKPSTITKEELEKFTFKNEVDASQQVLKSEGKIPLGSKRQVLVGNKAIHKGRFFERFRIWHIQAKNKERQWYTSDVITIHSVIDELETSNYDVSIRSNSRDLKEQLGKAKFPARYAKPALFKAKKMMPEEEVLTVDMMSVDLHKHRLQDSLIDNGATLEGTSKIVLTIPKGELDDENIKSMKLLRAIYGFDSTGHHDDDAFYVETSMYVLIKLGLNKFIDEAKSKSR